MSEYSEVVQGILDSLDDVDDKYKTIGDASTTLCDINNTVNQIPDSSVIRNVGGDVIGYDYKYTTPKLPDTEIMEIDSNTDSGMYATGGGGSSGGGGAGRGRHSTGKYAGTVNNNSQSTDKMNGSGLVSGVISSAWAGVSALAKLGKQVTSEAGETLATLAENFGNTFGDLCTDLGDTTANAIRVLFGVDSNGNTTMYMDEDTLGAFAITAKNDGFLDSGGLSPGNLTVDNTNSDLSLLDSSTRNAIINQSPYNNVTFSYGGVYTGKSTPTSTDGYVWNFSEAEFVVAFAQRGTEYGNYGSTYAIVGFSHSPFKAARSWGSLDMTPPTPNENAIAKTLPSNGHTWYVIEYGASNEGNYPSLIPNTVYYFNSGHWWLGVEIFEYGGVYPITPIPGVSDQTGAIIPVDAITGADPHAVAQNLANNYPTVMGTPIQIVVMDDSCNEKTINYYAVPISYSPTNVSINTPITGGLQINPSFNPDVTLDLPDIDIDNYIEQIINQLGGSGAGRDIVITEPDPITGDETIVTLPTTPPATGTGNTPEWTPDAEVGSSIMWQVYYVTAAQLQAFGRWLWISSNIVNDMKRIVANPMDAIFGLHKVYITPNYGSSTTIVVGNVDSEVSAFPVTNQYKSIVCGSVWVTEYFGNIYDYSPYTEISIYLPFIGIVPLSVDDIMRGEIAVDYTVDVYTGACIAEIMIYRDGVGGVLYQFNGNCAVEYPITAMSYNNSIMSLIGISSGVAGAIPQIMAGNPIGAGVTMTSSLIHSALQNREITQRSGSFSGNAGAMGSKKPYLIITRPQPEIANDYGDIEGYGANATVEIGNCEGFIKCRTVDLEISGAYKQELNEIEQLLKNGVYI